MVRPHCVLAGAATTCLEIAEWLLAVDAPKTARVESLKNPGSFRLQANQRREAPSWVPPART
jgi:hypothetical protein